MYSQIIKKKVRAFRRSGKTYTEIREHIRIDIPKSTLATWCRGVKLPKEYKEKIRKLSEKNLQIARKSSVKSKEIMRSTLIQEFNAENKNLLLLYKNDITVRKIVLATLYLAEGSKSPRGSLMFGNSDPQIVRTFVDLMRECYKIDESKFRCTIQCRADQDIELLQNFWSSIIRIPLRQFYGARVDKRTVGKKSRKLNYKGVCRIDYFCSRIDLELKCIAREMVSL